MGLISKLSLWDGTTYGNNVVTFRVLVECEKGSTIKYEYDDENDVMVVVHQLDKKYPYPFNYGSIPQTLANDGDSLDAIVIADEPIRSGTVVNCYPLAIVRMIDNGQEDDKVICTPFYTLSGLVDIKSIYRYLRKYKYPHQAGTALLSVDSKEKALEAINEAHKNFIRRVIR